MSSSTISGQNTLYPNFPEVYPTLEMLNDKPLTQDSKVILQMAKHLHNDYLLKEQLIEIVNRSMKDHKISIAGANAISALEAQGMLSPNNELPIGVASNSHLVTHLPIPTSSVNLNQKPKIERMDNLRLTPVSSNTRLIPSGGPSDNENYSKIIEETEPSSLSECHNRSVNACCKCDSCCCETIKTCICTCIFSCCDNNCCFKINSSCEESRINSVEFFINTRKNYCGYYYDMYSLEDNCTSCCWACMCCPGIQQQIEENT